MGKELCFLLGFYSREGIFTLLKHKLLLADLQMSSPLSHHVSSLKKGVNLKLYSKAIAT